MMQKDLDVFQKARYLFLKPRNEKALLRTDSKTQMEILKTAVEGSIYSPNEARRYVDKRAAPGGDKLLANGGMIALEQMGAQYGVDKTEKGGTENAPI